MKTLRTIIVNGGEMSGYAGQRGFYCKSVPVLVRAGLVERADRCRSCETGAPCERPTPAGNPCYARVRITDAGRREVDEPAPPVEDAASVQSRVVPADEPMVLVSADAARHEILEANSYSFQGYVTWCSVHGFSSDTRHSTLDEAYAARRAHCDTHEGAV